jgi:hypothetical protein
MRKRIQVQSLEQFLDDALAEEPIASELLLDARDRLANAISRTEETILRIETLCENLGAPN